MLLLSPSLAKSRSYVPSLRGTLGLHRSWLMSSSCLQYTISVADFSQASHFKAVLGHASGISAQRVRYRDSFLARDVAPLSGFHPFRVVQQLHLVSLDRFKLSREYKNADLIKFADREQLFA